MRFGTAHISGIVSQPNMNYLLAEALSFPKLLNHPTLITIVNTRSVGMYTRPLITVLGYWKTRVSRLAARPCLVSNYIPRWPRKPPGINHERTEKMTPLQLKNDLAKAKQDFYQSRISIEQLREAANQYRQSLIDYKKRTGKKLAIPSIAKLVR